MTERNADPALGGLPGPPFGGTARPYVRWWWLAGPFRQEDIVYQLDWVKAQGFGGVELAWLFPSWLSVSGPEQGRPAWLGREWSDLVSFAKQYASRIGLGCDFTLGSCWPFGGTCVAPDDAAQTFSGPSDQRLIGSWEDDSPQPQLIVNHLRRQALENYAAAMLPAFAGALAGPASALFCDSLELDTHGMWDAGLWEPFAARFGYRLERLADGLDDHPDVRYDYRKFVAETMHREFFEAFTDLCHRAGALSRVQCHGALTDLLAAYAAVDIPESEAILFNPTFSRIPASAAALARKPVVSCETFTCIYGFMSYHNPGPARYWRKENPADLKLLADALFAQGINQVIWHGMPFNAPGGRHEFYASVHVGPDAAFAPHLPRFNRYLEAVSSHMRQGRPCSHLAVYLPNEDNWMAGRIPPEERTPAAVYRWEMRHVTVPRETEPYAPLWVSLPFLKAATYQDGILPIGDAGFRGLYVDCAWLDGEALVDILRLARTGLPVILRRQPQQPGAKPRGQPLSMFRRLTPPGLPVRWRPAPPTGHMPPAQYAGMLQELTRLPQVIQVLDQARIIPLVTGDDLPTFWARQTDEHVLLFFAHPAARDVRYPIRYGQSAEAVPTSRQVRLHIGPSSRDIRLDFERYQSLLLRVGRQRGDVEIVEIRCPVPDPANDVSAWP